MLASARAQQDSLKYGSSVEGIAKRGDPEEKPKEEPPTPRDPASDRTWGGDRPENETKSRRYIEDEDNGGYQHMYAQNRAARTWGTHGSPRRRREVDPRGKGSEGRPKHRTEGSGGQDRRRSRRARAR